MSRSRSRALLVVAVLLMAALLVHLRLGGEAGALLERVEGLGAWAGVVLAAIWIPAALLCLPGSLITLGTGFLLLIPLGHLAISTLAGSRAVGSGDTVPGYHSMGAAFVAAVVTRRSPTVDGLQGKRALALASQIVDRMTAAV